MLCALIAGCDSIPKEPSDEKGDVLPSLVPRPLVPVSQVEVSQEFWTYEKKHLNLGPREFQGPKEWEAFLSTAASSARKCVTEGTEEALPYFSENQGPLRCSDYPLICRECGQTSSTRSSNGRYEEHDFIPIESVHPRFEPSIFRQSLRDVLPMWVNIRGLDLEELQKPMGCENKLWAEWSRALYSAVGTENAPSDFRLADISRSHIWTAHYICRGRGRLELRISEWGATWLVFAEKSAEKSAHSGILERPIARLRVRCPDTPTPFSLTDGVVEICLPVDSLVHLSIQGKGERVDSWRKRLGLKGKFQEEFEFSSLSVKVEKGSSENMAVVEGTYDILPKCGGACGSLRKKRRASGGSTSVHSTGDVFLMLESGRKSLPDEDVYIFASTCHRTTYGEYRETFLEVTKDSKFRPTRIGDDLSLSINVQASTPGEWLTLDSASLSAPSVTPCALFPNSSSKELSLPIHQHAWKTCPELVRCELPGGSFTHLVQQCNMHGGSVEVNLSKSKRLLQDVAFVTSRLSIPEVFASESWQQLDRSRMSVEGDEDVVCLICSPTKPHVKWRHVRKGRKTTFQPIEDGQEAAVYERALKARPNPWLLRFLVEQTTANHRLSLQVGFNADSMVQRSLGLFPRGTPPRKAMVAVTPDLSRCSYDWRIVPHVEKARACFPKLLISSNKLDEEAEQPPNFKKFKLRREQLRSLHWMLQMESSTKDSNGYAAGTFFEEEVTEAVLPGLNWRAEGRVCRPVLVRGGIIADEVGYGKTAITLGLIDSAKYVNEESKRPPKNVIQGFIQTKATLVVVPAHLMGQWPSEIRKFLPATTRVCVIKDMSSFNKLTIDSVKKADIVVVNFSVLSNEKYFSRLARLSGINPGSLPSGSTGGRRFNAVYYECLSGLRERVSQIVGACEEAFASVSDAASAYSTTPQSTVRHDKKKSAYMDCADATKVGEATAYKVDAKERDPWGLSRKSVQLKHERMTSPPLEMFYFDRIVVDEFTYLADSRQRERASELVNQLKSSFRWCLSGTPAHKTFNDVQVLGKLLGVHLGVDEVPLGNKVSKRTLSTETTGLENLSHYLDVRTTQWHERRHQLAQSFLNKFVRQNIAEIDEIPFEESQIQLTLPPAERAIYLELETHLKSLEMNSQNAKKSKKRTTGDRDSRVQKAIVDAESAEEALLKCCCHFNLSSEDGVTASETVEDIINKRISEKNKLEEEITQAIAAAFRQKHRILEIQPSWKSVFKTQRGEIHDALREFLAFAEKNESVPHGADDCTNSSIREIVQKAKQNFQAKPHEVDEAFAQASGIEVEKESDDEGHKSKKRKTLTKHKQAGVDDDTLFAMKFSLRNHMHEVRTMGKALCGRIRSLRFIQVVRRFQSAEQTDSTCTACSRSGKEMGVLSCCGHDGCLSCLREWASKTRCIAYPSCRAQGVSAAHIVSAKDLGLDKSGSSSGHFGCKLTAVVEKVKFLIVAGDRLIVFCQFDDLAGKVCAALSRSGVLSMQVCGTVQQQVKAVSIFQKDKPEKNDPHVLILKMDDEQSAGLNLTNLNHAIFVHPLLAASQQKYEAYETQSLGRIRRYGQKKTVYLWRFLVEDTIDTEIFEKRSSTTAGS